MLKGCQKKIIHITNTGSPYFEEAYFILRRLSEGAVSEDDMVREAMRIAEDASGKKALRPKRNARLPSILLLSLSLVSFVFGTVMLVIMLFA